MVLRRRKLLDKQIENADSKLEKVEEMLMAMETSEMQKMVLESIQSSTTALQKLQATMKLEDIDVLLQENKEAVEYEEQVSAMLGRELDATEAVDEEELEAELEKYAEMEKEKEGEGEKEKMNKEEDIAATDAQKNEMNLPDAPTQMPAKVIDDDRADIKEADEKRPETTQRSQPVPS